MKIQIILCLIFVMEGCLGCGRRGKETASNHHKEHDTSSSGASHVATGCGIYPKGSTMCLPKADCSKTGGGPCGKLSEKHKQMILDIHNNYRQQVAAGKEKRGNPGPQPPGTDIYELQWSDELAEFAQRWAEQMVKKPHDDYIPDRQTKKFKYVGQNVYWYYRDSKITDTRWKKAIFGWYDEVKDVNPKGFTNPNGKVIGHYTQLLWAKTYMIGCGVYGSNNMKCGFRNKKLQNFYGQKYVCNYGPAGNFNNLPVYTSIGKCKKSSAKYPNLCAK